MPEMLDIHAARLGHPGGAAGPRRFAGHSSIVLLKLGLAWGVMLGIPGGTAAAPADRAVSARLGLSRFTVQRLEPTSDPGSFPLRLDGRPVTVRIARAAIRATGFRLLVQQPDGSLRDVPPPSADTYRGTVAEIPGSVVGGTMRDGMLSAAIALPDGRTYFVQPLRDAIAEGDRALHVVYLDDPAAATGSCPVDEPAAVVTPRSDGTELAPAAGPLVADLAIDADYELFVLNGSSVDATVHDVETVLSNVNAVYDRDCGIQHRLVALIVRASEPDPYSTTAPDSLLDQFRNHWNTAQTGIARDVAHFMTGKDLNGGVIGIASVGVVCNRSRAYGLSQTRFTSNLGRRTALTAHELGHEWNAVHCDGTNPCNIMCSSIDGCNGIGLPNFEPMGATAIKSFAASRTCLDSPTLAVPAAAVTGTVEFAPPRPSPFTRETRLSYFLSAPGPVRLDVYDIAGHRVATLARGVEGEGWHSRVWNGRDGAGTLMRTGVFHARLEAGGAVRVQKLILIQ